MWYISIKRILKKKQIPRPKFRTVDGESCCPESEPLVEAISAPTGLFSSTLLPGGLMPVSLLMGSRCLSSRLLIPNVNFTSTGQQSTSPSLDPSQASKENSPANATSISSPCRREAPRAAQLPRMNSLPWLSAPMPKSYKDLSLDLHASVEYT